ncbi:MAG: hypothetical protein HOQ05_10830 [Corynebacteriales bacterium]|nr:hypothetical protein [Mycobacteriales bacterium]
MNIVSVTPVEEPMTVEQAYQTMWRHQPASDGISYERNCAICSGMVPCAPQRQAAAALSAHGHNPSPSAAQIENALNLQFLG